MTSPELSCGILSAIPKWRRLACSRRQTAEQVNLEHVLPKRASSADWGNFSPDERRDYLHRLGNLSLLPKGPNGRIGNKPFAAKKPLLAKSSFALTAEIGLEADWTKDAIKARQARLAELALKVCPR